MHKSNINLQTHFETLCATDATGDPPPMSELQAAVAGRSRRRLVQRSAGLGVVVALLAGGLAFAEAPGGNGGEVTTEAVTAEESSTHVTSPPAATPPSETVAVPSAPESFVLTTVPQVAYGAEVAPTDSPAAPGPEPSAAPEPPATEPGAPTPEEPAEPYVPYVPTKPLPVGPQRADWSFLPYHLERVTAESTSFVVSSLIPARCWRPAVLPVGPEGGIEGIVQPYVDWEDATIVVEETDETITVTGVYEPPSAEEWYAPFEPGWFECTYNVNYTVELSSPVGDREIYDGAEQEWPLL